MTGSRLAIVRVEAPLARNIEAYLRERLVAPALVCGFDEIGEHLAQDTDGVLLVIGAQPADVEPITRLVQDLSLQKLPPTVVIVEADGFSEGALFPLLPHVSRRLSWPRDADALVQIVRDRWSRGREFLENGERSLEELLRRRLLAQTPSLLPVVDGIALAARHDVTVLLSGETGSGKTFLARLIHDHSPRERHRFLTVACGAITANLVESEFFGHVKGAFTGADRPKIGKFAAVGQGTLLLDEIDTLSLEQQATLLRVIETGEFEPVGSVETQRCQARLIVASNLDLEEAVARGRFRPDLYFRLNVMSFHLPPLRERVFDIAPLARAMAARFNRKFHKSLFHISPAAMAALEAFDWPGNLRQLENTIQHAVLVSSGPELRLEHLPQPVQDFRLALETSGQPDLAAGSLHHQRDRTERSVIQQALANNGYSRSRAAESLGISRVTLYKKMRKYGLMSIPLQTVR